jgi:hypothetical protein
MATEPKTTVKTPEKVPQPHGGALNAGGTPGNKGGRPPSAFKESIRALINDRETLRTAEKILWSGGKRKKATDIHPQFTSLLSKLITHVEGIPGRSKDADPADGPSSVIVDL